MSDATSNVCDHLTPLLSYVVSQGAKVSFAGQAWSSNCRTWVYVDRVLDLESLRAKVTLAPCVRAHVHRGTHDGAEQGFECVEHKDAVMGLHPDVSGGAAVIS